MEKCRLICKECNKEYASKQSLCNHMTNIHKNKKQKVSNQLDELINNNNNIDKTKVYKCKFCDKTYKHKQSRTKHHKSCKSINALIYNLNIKRTKDIAKITSEHDTNIKNINTELNEKIMKLTQNNSPNMDELIKDLKIEYDFIKLQAREKYNEKINDLDELYKMPMNISVVYTGDKKLNYVPTKKIHKYVHKTQDIKINKLQQDIKKLNTIIQHKNNSKNDSENNTISDIYTKPYKKKSIPKILRNQSWDVYIGKEKGIGNCFCCNAEIDSKHFECGHIIPACKGGPNTLENLRPICSLCNRSIGSKNMNDFIKKYMKKPSDKNTVEI
jgi:hypothetical protein